MKDDCIFCKIVNGEIKSYEIYEDQLVKVFLDAYPVNKGHTLVIPKEHYKDIYDIPENVMGRIGEVAKKIAEKYKGILSTDGVNLLQSNGGIAGQVVFHSHLHIVPRYKNDGIDMWFHRQSKKEVDLEKLHKEIKEKF